MSSVYILEIRPLSEVSLANMFSHTVGSLFILILFSLAMQKLFILMRSHLFILSFISPTLGDISAKILLCGISEIILPLFSPRTCMVSHTFKSCCIHLQFIQKTVVHLHNGVLHSRKKEGAPTLHNSMDGTAEYHAK